MGMNLLISMSGSLYESYFVRVGMARCCLEVATDKVVFEDFIEDVVLEG